MRVMEEGRTRHPSWRTIALRLLMLSTLLFGSSAFAQSQEAQPTPSIRDEIRNQFTPSDFRRLLNSEAGGLVDQGGKVVASAPADVLGNNNGGAGSTANFTQSETTILAFGNNVLLGFNDSGSNAGGTNKFTGFAYSTDGGATFTDGGTLPTNPGGDAGDPVMARNESTGRIYFSTLGFSVGTIQVFRSDDGGITWMPPVNGTPGGSSEDKQWMAVDNFPGAGNGNVYMLSRRFGTGPGIYFFRSTDDGNTFGPTGGTLIVSGQQGAFVAVGPDHAVYALWWNGSTIQMRKSTDFGATFAGPVTVASGLAGGLNGDLALTGIRQGTATAAGFRSNSFPHAAVNPVSGDLYVTFNDNPAGTDKADVYMVMSTDGGATWSAPVRINDDATTTDQWQPTIACTPDGTGLGIFYYSRQEDPAGNNLYKYYGRLGYISGSTVTFTPSFAISDDPSLPEFGRDAVVNTTYMGDYDFAVATPGFFHVAWADNRSDLAGGAPRKDPNVYYEKIPAGLQTGPNIFVSPASVNFGDVAVSQTRTVQVIVTNAGDAPLVLSSVGSAAPDFGVQNFALPAVIPSLGSLTIDVSFTPATLGTQSSSCNITSNALNAPVVTVNLTGTGVENIRVAPLSVDFGTVPVGQTAGPVPVTIENTGSLALTVSAISTPAGDFSITPPALPVVLPPTGTTTVDAYFSPTATGPHSSSFDITSDAIGAPTVTVSLAGEGIVAPLNDLCADAIPLECGSTVDGTTVLSTFDNVGTCGTSNTAPGVWYSVVGTGAPITVSTCAGASFDTKLSVFTGDCGALTCVGGNDDFSGCSLRSRVTFNSVRDQTYYVLVHGFMTATGTFTLEVSTCPAEIDVTPASLTLTVPYGQTGSGDLTVSNTALPGALDLNWTALSGITGPIASATAADFGPQPIVLFQVTDETLTAIRRLVPTAVRRSLESLVGQPPAAKAGFIDLVTGVIGADNTNTFYTVILENTIQFHDGLKETPESAAMLAGLEGVGYGMGEVPGMLGAGGPDAFGYEWKDSDDPDGPAFAWVDITGTGTPVVLGDDASVLVPLPFSFPFYGVDQTQVRISSNGYLTFGTSGATFTNTSIPNGASPNDIICPFWDDLNPASTSGGTVHYLATPTQFIVQYTDIRRFGTTQPNTFQAILNDDGSIVFQYLDMQGLLTSSTVGIENAAGTVGLQVAFNAAYIHDNLAVRLALPEPCPWITSITPDAGTLPPGGSEAVTVAVDAAGLAIGSYQCNVRFSSNAANAPALDVPVTLNVVNDPPQWVNEAGSGDQAVQYSDSIAAVTLQVTDDGATGGDLTISSAWTKDGGASTPGLPGNLSLSAGDCETHADGSKSCSWTLSGQTLVAAGEYVISFTAGDGTENSAPFTVTLTVNPEDAAIAFDGSNPVSVQVDAPGGDSPSFQVVVDVTEFDDPDDVAGDRKLAGDINQAVVSVMLVPVGPGGNVSPVGPCASVVTPGLADPDSPYDYDTRTITCTFDNVPVNTYAVVVTVDGGYYAGSGEDVLTVYDPSLGFTTGGGWFYWPGTADGPSGYPGDKTKFGFNVQFNKKGNQTKGSLLVIRHRADGSSARLKSNAMSGLAVGEGTSGSGTFGWASFSGKATFQAFEAPEPIGNHDFVAYVEDHGTPGSSDRFWVSVSDAGTAQTDLSLAGPGSANAVTIGGGNIVVPHGTKKGGKPSASSGTDDPVLPVAFGMSPSLPNPFRGETSIQFQLPVDTHARLVVYDISGREVARLVDGRLSAGNHQVAWRPFNVPGGVYFARFTAGTFSQTRRMTLLK